MQRDVPCAAECAVLGAAAEAPGSQRGRLGLGVLFRACRSGGSEAARVALGARSGDEKRGAFRSAACVPVFLLGEAGGRGRGCGEAGEGGEFFQHAKLQGGELELCARGE